MKPPRVLPVAFLVALLATGAEFFPPLPGVAAEPEPKKKDYSTNAADREACEHQLNWIHGAIQEYYKRNRRLPRWLSDLCPEFLHDRETLICPYVKNTGSFKRWREQHAIIPVFGDAASSYAYEYCTALIQPVIGKTCHDYKKRQMEVLGFSVPVVRCFAHKRYLNLAYDGNVYESELTWEDNFVRSKADQKFFHNVGWITTKSQNEAVAEMLPPREANIDGRLLDLTKYYNALLLHLSQLDPSGKLLSLHPQGITNIDGIQFDVRGLVHLSTTGFPNDFPEKIENIPINRKCARIHFLHGAMFEAPPGSRIASFGALIDGEHPVAIPILYGKDVKTRWFNPRQGAGLDPKPAWVSPPDQAGSARKSLRLYRKTWENPAPEVPVKTLSFVSHMTASTPFLLAITLDAP